MYLSQLIKKLQKIEEKHGDIPIAGRYVHGMTYAYKEAELVEILVKRPKTEPKLWIGTYVHERY